MTTFYKCLIVDRRQYYENSNGIKEYLTGDNENDKTLMEAAMLSGKGLNSNDVINETFGVTEQEANNAAEAYVCVKLSEFKSKGIKFGISVPEKVEADISIEELEEIYKKK